MLIGLDASRAAPEAAGVGRYSRELLAAIVAGSDHRFVLYANGLVRPEWAKRPNCAWRDLPFPRLWTHVRLSGEMLLHPPEALFVPAHVIPPRHPRATVVTIHDLGYLRFPDCHPPRQRLYLRLATLWNARSARRILVDSEATGRDLQTMLGVPAKCISVAYPGVPPGFIPQALCEIRRVRQEHHLPERYLLFVGTLQPRKNLVRLMSAHAAVREAPPLVLAGGVGWMSDQIVQRADTSGGRVLRLGFVPDADLPGLISGAEALLLPSLYEGFGIPALEAMACGTPVIASTTSSLPEVVAEAGLLVDPLSEEQIAAAIREVITNDDLAQDLARRGLERSCRFTWESCAAVALRAIEEAYAGV